MKNSRRSDSRSLQRCSKPRPKSKSEDPLTVLTEPTSDRCSNLLVRMTVHLRNQYRLALRRLLPPSRASRISSHLCTDKQPSSIGTRTLATTAQPKGSKCCQRTSATLLPRSALSKRGMLRFPMCETVSTIRPCMS